jgi:hypothetical protein
LAFPEILHPELILVSVSFGITISSFQVGEAILDPGDVGCGGTPGNHEAEQGRNDEKYGSVGFHGVLFGSIEGSS